MNHSLINFYSNKYNLKKLKLNFDNKKVIYLIYDEKYYYYLDKNDDFISSSDNEILLDFIKKINKKYNLQICNYYPVCFCNNTLVIALRTIECSSSLKKINYKNMPEKYKKLIAYHREKYKTSFLSLNVKKEIEMSQKYIKRYRFHERIIKKYFLTPERRKKKEYEDLLTTLIPNEKSIIDVSCGDSSDVFKVAKDKKFKEIIGNDICINYLDLKKSNNVIYTNDDIEHNDIKNKVYDVAYCKNTLHHMNNISNIDNLLQFIKKIANEIIIVEIINPKTQGGLPKFLNKYLYTRFLKDAGTCYLSESEFKTLINNNFNDEKIRYYTFENILGKYMIVKISSKGE